MSDEGARIEWLVQTIMAMERRLADVTQRLGELEHRGATPPGAGAVPLQRQTVVMPRVLTPPPVAVVGEERGVGVGPTGEGTVRDEASHGEARGVTREVISSTVLKEAVVLPPPVVPPPPPASPVTAFVPRRVAVPSAAAPAPDQSKTIESQIGLKVFAWFGALIVVLGMLFFLKYAWDNNWIHPTPLGRVCMGLGIGAVLMGLGQWSFVRKMRPLAASLYGGGHCGADGEFLCRARGV